MFTKFLKLTTLIFLIIIIGCKKKIEEQQLADNTNTVNNEYVFYKDAASLSNRIDRSKMGVLNLNSVNKNGRSAGVIASVNPYPFTLIGSINAPTVNGNATIPTKIDVPFPQTGNSPLPSIAYVGYRRKSGSFAGAIDIINFNNLGNPVLVQSVSLPHTDVYQLKVWRGKLYFSGSTNISENRTLSSAGVFGYFDLNTAGTFVGTSTTFSLPIDIAYDFTFTQSFGNNNVYIVGGPSGYAGNTDSKLFEFNYQTNSIITTLGAANNLYDLRAINCNTSGNNNLNVYSARDGIHVFQRSDLSQPSFHPQSKDSVGWPIRTITESLTTGIFVCAGKNGFKMFDRNSITEVDKILPPSSLPNVNSNDIGAFDVNQNGGLMSVSMGAAGLYLTVANTSFPNNGFVLYGNYEFPGEIVYSASQYIYNLANTSILYLLVATNNGIKVVEVPSSAQLGNTATAPCNSVPLYSGGVDYVLTSGNSASFGGSMGVQTMHIGGNYTHCGSVSISKNFTLGSGGSMFVRGNVTQGFTNTSHYFSVGSGSTLTIEGDLTIYGDLHLEGNIVFVGANRKIRVYGNVTKSPAAQILGNPTVVVGNLTPSNTFNTNISLVTVNNQPNTSQGVYVFDGTTMPSNSYLQFTAVFPRNVNYNDTLDISENGVYKFRVLYPHEYRGGALRYTKSNGNLETLSFPVRPIAMPVNPSQAVFFQSFRHNRNIIF